MLDLPNKVWNVYYNWFVGPLCEDNEASCSQLAKEGACQLYPTWMLFTCRKSCDNCGCDDLAANCSSLAKEQKCLDDGHVDWMLRNCRRSCKVCLGEKNECFPVKSSSSRFALTPFFTASSHVTKARLSLQAIRQGWVWLDPFLHCIFSRNEGASVSTGNQTRPISNIEWAYSITMHRPTHSLKATTASVMFVHALCGNITNISFCIP